MANIMDQKTKYLIGKWGKRISMTEKTLGEALTYEKRAALANSLENTQQHIRAMEAVNPSAIGQYKRYALDIVNAVVPNLIAFDCYAVQAMDNRIGMLNYIDYRYSKGKGTTKDGDVFASSINMGKSDPNYTSDYVDKEYLMAKSATSCNYTLAWLPVFTAGGFEFTAGANVATGTIGAVNPATGIATVTVTDITGTTGLASGTCTYAPATGNLVFTGISAAEDVAISYHFNNEDVRSDGLVAAGTNVPEIELKINSVPIEAHARTLRSFWSFDAQYELQKEYGQDIEKLLATQSTGEIAHEIDNELTLDLYKYANAGAPIIWSKTLTPGIALVDHYDSFMMKLTEGANKIFDATRRVKANFIVCGLDVATVIESMRNFTPSGVTAVGPHFLGTLGNYKVFVNPDYVANAFVLGYKGSTMFDAGAFYCPYMPVSSTDLIMDANFRGQRGYATMYGKKILNDKMFIKGFITD